MGAPAATAGQVGSSSSGDELYLNHITFIVQILAALWDTHDAFSGATGFLLFIFNSHTDTTKCPAHHSTAGP